MEDSDDEFKHMNSAMKAKFQLGDAMINASQFAGLRAQQKKFKKVLGELEVYIKRHETDLQTKCVSQEHLKITTELFDSKMEERLKRGMMQLEVTFNQKLKSMITMKELDERFVMKVGVPEFQKTVEQINNQLAILQDDVDTKLPAMALEVRKALDSKYTNEAVDKLLAEKASHESIKEFEKRIHDLENNMKNQIDTVRRQATQSALSRTEKTEKNTEKSETAEVDGQSEKPPTDLELVSPLKNEELMQSLEEVEKLKESNKKMQEQLKSLQTMVTKLNTQVTADIDGVRKMVDEQRYDLKKVKDQVSGMELKQKNAELLVTDAMASTGGGKAAAGGGGGGGDGRVSGAQQQFNKQVRERLDDLAHDVDRLLKLDTRLNRDLIKRPYEYIDKIKDNLMKENHEIVKVVKSNNERFVQKVATIETKVDQAIGETHLLIETYKKKVGEIGKNMERAGKVKADVQVALGGMQRELERITSTCDENHCRLSEILRRIAAKFAVTQVDSESAEGGYNREMERLQVLFRELQSELVTTLEEKKHHNEVLLRSTGIKEVELKKIHELVGEASAKKLEGMLPQIQQNHLNSTLRVSGRQDKILSIFRQEKLSPNLNSSRKFYKSQSKKSQSTTLRDAEGKTNLLPGGASAFLTQDGLASTKNFTSRKGSHKPQPTELDFLSKLDQQNSVANLGKKIQSVKHIDDSSINFK